MAAIVISQLWIYPIKSLKGIAMDHVQLEKRGFQYDRRWMLVDENNRFLTQRQFPRMALIEQQLTEFGISLHAPDMPALIVPYPDFEVEQYAQITVTCWDDSIEALHVNSAIDNWFSEFLQVDCQLVYMPDDCIRPVDQNFVKHDDIASFSDGFPNLVISEASLADLNEKVANVELTMSRFRPNIVISDCDAYEEDTLAHFQINEIDFFAVKPCSRCIITTIDPLTGKKGKGEPLATLASYRKKNNKVFFGQNILHKLNYRSDNQLKIGDSLTIIDRNPPIKFD